MIRHRRCVEDDFFAIKCAIGKKGAPNDGKIQFGAYFVALFVMKLGGAVGTWAPKCEKKKNGAHEMGFFYQICTFCT